MAKPDQATRQTALEQMKLDVDELEYKIRLHKATEEWDAIRKTNNQARQAKKGAAGKGETAEG